MVINGDKMIFFTGFNVLVTNKKSQMSSKKDTPTLPKHNPSPKHDKSTSNDSTHPVTNNKSQTLSKKDTPTPPNHSPSPKHDKSAADESTKSEIHN